MYKTSHKKNSRGTLVLNRTYKHPLKSEETTDAPAVKPPCKHTVVCALRKMYFEAVKQRNIVMQHEGKTKAMPLQKQVLILYEALVRLELLDAYERALPPKITPSELIAVLSRFKKDQLGLCSDDYSAGYLKAVNDICAELGTFSISNMTWKPYAFDPENLETYQRGMAELDALRAEMYVGPSRGIGEKP